MVAYLYDARGRRVAKIVDGATTHYVHDTQYRVLEERADDGTLLARYTYGSGMDEPLTMERGGNNYYYHRDILGETSEVYYLHRDLSGNLTEVTDGNQNILGRARYTALGEVLSSTIPITLTGRLPAGGEVDPDAGLVYAGDGRYYDPALGLYLQPDTFGGAPEAPESLNRYAALGVSTLPTLGSVPTRGASKRASYNLTVNFSFLVGGTWYAQQAAEQAVDLGAEYLSQRSLVRFTLEATRNRMLKKLPKQVLKLMGGSTAVREWPAGKHHVWESGWQLIKGQLTKTDFANFTFARGKRYAKLYDDFFHDFSWLDSAKANVGIAVGVEVFSQWFWPGSGDVWNYNEYGLTLPKFAGRTAVAIAGGLFEVGAVAAVGYTASLIVGAPVTLSIGAAIGIAIGAAAVWEGIAKPILYELFNLYGEHEAH